MAVRCLEGEAHSLLELLGVLVLECWGWSQACTTPLSRTSCCVELWVPWFLLLLCFSHTVFLQTRGRELGSLLGLWVSVHLGLSVMEVTPVLPWVSRQETQAADLFCN
jgi:hypothetical protein